MNDDQSNAFNQSNASNYDQFEAFDALDELAALDVGDEFDGSGAFAGLDDHSAEQVSERIEAQIAYLVRDAVAEEWVRPVEDVFWHVADELGVDEPEVIKALRVLVEERMDDEGVRRLGERMVDVTRFAEMAHLTHRLSVREIDDDALDLDVDLALLVALAEADGGLHRPDDAAPLHLRSRVTFTEEDPTAPLIRRRLVGPQGWLADYAAGDVVVLHGHDGYLEVQAADALEPAAAVAERLRDHVMATIDERNEGDDSPIGADEIVLTGLVDGWWPNEEVLPPLSEVVEALGFEAQGDLVGPPGCWEQYGRLRHAIGLIVRHFDHLDDKARKAVTGLAKAFEDFCDDATVTPDAGLALQLHRCHGEGAMCLSEELQRIDPGGERILAFVAALPAPRGSAAAVLHSLEALGHELSGVPVAAEAAVDTATLSDPTWFPAIDAKLNYVEARGDLRATVNLMAVLREPDDPELVSLRERLRLLNPDVGRNEPCPCGSGRKFKQCHQGRNELPIRERVGWLLERAANWVEHFGEVDIDTVTTSISEAVPGRADELLAAVLADMVLFEMGGLGRFLTARRHLLPADDVALLEDWVARERTSLYRVEGIADDGTLTLVDIAVTSDDDRSGGGPAESFQVARSQAFSTVSVHGLVWCRLLPVADGWVSSGVVMPARLQDRAHMLEALDQRRAIPTDAGPAQRRTAVAEYLRTLLGGDGAGGMLAGDGFPWVHGIASWHVGDDRAAVVATLGHAFGSDTADVSEVSGDELEGDGSDGGEIRGWPDGEWTWLDEKRTVLASFRLGSCYGPNQCAGAPAHLLDTDLEERLNADEEGDDEDFDEAFREYLAQLDAGLYGYDVTVSAGSVPRLHAAGAELERLFPGAVQGRMNVTPGRRHHAFLMVDDVLESIENGGYASGIDDDDDLGLDPADLGLDLADVGLDLDDDDPGLGSGEAFRDDALASMPGAPIAGGRLDEVMGHIPVELRDQVLEEAVRTYEQQWLDMEIPALGGHTPREAAADPALRADLLTLLAEMAPVIEQVGDMSAARIRSALGLDPA